MLETADELRASIAEYVQRVQKEREGLALPQV